MSRNVWHFMHKRTGILYVEWKYFNIISEHICGFISYIIVNPSNKYGLRKTLLNYTLFSKDSHGKVTELKGEPYFDEKTFKIGDHSITAEEDTLRIKGKHDGLRWDLKYTPTTSTSLELPNYKVGIFNWERLSWESPIPRAKVNGTVSIGKKRYSVLGNGYHDCNWGTWLGIDALWHWMQTNTKDTSIVLAEIYNRKKGGLFIDCGKKIKFDHNEITVKHLEWNETPEGFIPVKTKLTADNGKDQVDIQIKMLRNHMRFVKRPLLPRQGIHVSFQQVKTTGTLKTGRKSMKISNKGFREYTFYRPRRGILS